MKTKINELTDKGQLFIVHPTLEMLSETCENRKLKAHQANMEYSNFMKHCRMQTDLRINTYVRCAAAFDMDVLILHLPKGLINSLTNPKHQHNSRYATIDKEELIILLSELCKTDHKKQIRYLLVFLDQFEKMINTGKTNKLADFAAQLLMQINVDNGK